MGHRRRYSSRLGRCSKIGIEARFEGKIAKLPAWIRHHSSHLVEREGVLPSLLVQLVVETVDSVVDYSIRFSGCYPTVTAYSSPRFDLLVVVSLQVGSGDRVLRPIRFSGEQRNRGHHPTIFRPG